jgi:hypothetical protein
VYLSNRHYGSNYNTEYVTFNRFKLEGNVNLQPVYPNVQEFVIYSGANLAFRAVNEIIIKPGVNILAGSETRLYIGAVDCDDNVQLPFGDLRKIAVSAEPRVVNVHASQPRFLYHSWSVPQPARGTVTLNARYPRLVNGSPEFYIVDALGSRVILEPSGPVKVVADPGGETVASAEFDVSSLIPGVYWGVFNAGALVTTCKVLIYR